MRNSVLTLKCKIITLEVSHTLRNSVLNLKTCLAAAVLKYYPTSITYLEELCPDFEDLPSGGSVETGDENVRVQPHQKT